MSIAVLRKKTKFKNRVGANRTDYNYIGQPKGLAYKGFALNMSNRGNVTGRNYNSGVHTSSSSCHCKTSLISANERQSNCVSCNKSVVAKQISYRNYIRRATESVSNEKGSSLRARVSAGEGKSTWKRGPSFDMGLFIDNKKSSVIQCTEPVGTNDDGFDANGCFFHNKIRNPTKNTCNVTLGKTSYTRISEIPCNTSKSILKNTASDQIARVKANRVCKTQQNGSCVNGGQEYESPIMNDNQRRIC